MKEYSNQLSVYPISEIDNSNPDPWKTDIIGSHSFLSDDFAFDPTPSEAEGGVLFNCDTTFIVDTPSDSELALFSIPVRSILVLRDTDSVKYPIGTITIPGTVQIQKGIQKSRLIFKANTLINPL